MTREAILKLKGRELDREIAEVVMGFRPCSEYELIDWDNSSGKALHRKCNHDKSECFPDDSVIIPPQHDHLYNLFGLNRYSTDMNDAMLVVEKMRERGYDNFGLRQWKHKLWTCRFANIDGKQGTFEKADNPAEAICKAALLALESK